MGIQRKSEKPAGITNEQGEPEIVLTIGDKVISLAPPKAPDESRDDDADD